MLEASAPLCGCGWLTLFVSELRVELPLAEFVSEEGRLIVALSVPDCRVAEAPVPVVSVALVSVAVTSPVSLRAQPAKQIKVAAINANFFIIQLLVCAREPCRSCLAVACDSLARNYSHLFVPVLNGVKIGLRTSTALMGWPSAGVGSHCSGKTRG